VQKLSDLSRVSHEARNGSSWPLATIEALLCHSPFSHNPLVFLNYTLTTDGYSYYFPPHPMTIRVPQFSRWEETARSITIGLHGLRR